jgi:SAM-dependent methyltransferase
MPQPIGIDQISFEPASRIDDSGRVFAWNGGLYRAIRYDYAEFYHDLLRHRDLHLLLTKGLVFAEIASLSVEGYGLILKHHRIPFLSYCMEWSPEMLRDAALLICDINIELHKTGLCTKDVHPWNILFDNARPVFIDWGSITSLQKQPVWPYHKFRDFYLSPLMLMSAGLSKIARTLMIDTNASMPFGSCFQMILRYLPPWRSFEYLLYATKHLRRPAPPSTSVLHSLIKLIKRIPIHGQESQWTNYRGPQHKYSHHQPANWHPKIMNVFTLLNRYKPKSVLDIGCNKGWFAELAELQGGNVVAIDIDEPSIDLLYHHAKASNLKILPLIVDVCNPTPAHGTLHAFTRAQDRLKADMVLALGITHHLVFKRNLIFAHIAKQLSEFSRKWLIVEFVPHNDVHVSKWMNSKYDWYNLDGFVKSLGVYFRNIDVLDSFPWPRVLLICER